MSVVYDGHLVIKERRGGMRVCSYFIFFHFLLLSSKREIYGYLSYVREYLHIQYKYRQHT